MASTPIFLFIFGTFTGLCFVVGCIASVIKAVRDRRRILKNRSERARTGKDRGSDELMHSPSSSSSSEKVDPILPRNDSTSIECKRQDSNKSGRKRKAANPGDDKTEPDYKLMEGPCHDSSDTVEDSVSMSVLEKSYGAHSQSKTIVLNDEALTDQEKEKEGIADEVGFRPEASQQAKSETNGTFLIDNLPPVARTKSYQAAMDTTIIEESPSLSETDVSWSSRENILKANC